MPDTKTRQDSDEEELQTLVGTPLQGCAIKGCDEGEVDPRGPVWMNAKDGTATEYWVCQSHWEGIFTILGNQYHDFLLQDDVDVEDGYVDGRALEDILDDLKEREHARPIFVDDDESRPESYGGHTPSIHTDDETDAYERGYELMDEAGRLQDDDDYGE